MSAYIAALRVPCNVFSHQFDVHQIKAVDDLLLDCL